MATRVAEVLDSLSRASLWLIAFVVLALVPWLFGGMGPEGYWVIVWAGRACLLPLVLWAVSSILIRRAPPVGFWVALVCWSLLAVQVWLSLGNPSQVPGPPWEGGGYKSVVFNPLLPNTAALWRTPSEGLLWLSYGLLALTAYSVGLARRGFVALCWSLAVTTALLAAIGIPFKYSGNYRMLGVWEMPENYFFSTFTYHNHWCAFALLGLAATMGLFFEHRSMRARASLIVLGVVIAASAPISVSRLGTLFLGSFLAFAGLVFFQRSVITRSRGWRQGLLLFACVLGTLLLVGGAVVFLNRNGPGSVGQRTWSYIIRQNPFHSRLELVEDAIPMVAKKPLFGWGLGSFGQAFRDYQRPESIVVFNQGRVTRYEHCHNDWMERLVELGFVGCFLAFLPLGVWLVQRPRGQRFPAANWVLCGVAFLCIFALGDMAFVNRAVAVATVLLVSLVGSSRVSNQGNPAVVALA